MASSAPNASGSTDDPEQGDVAAVPKSRLHITVRLSDIIQLNLVIGRSRFGEIKLAKSRQADEIYALKALRKSRCLFFSFSVVQHVHVFANISFSHRSYSILELFELNHCKNERPVLQILKHPFVVNFVSSFQDVRVVYFLMDYYPGGNLMRLLSLGKLAVSHARQITAQVNMRHKYWRALR